MVLHRLIVALAVLAVVVSAARAQVEFGSETFPYDKSHPAEGYWLGNIEHDESSVVAAFEITRDDGRYAAKFTSLAFGAIGSDVKSVTVDAPAVEIVIDGPAGEFTFTGSLSEDGQRLTGVVARAEAEDRGSFELGRSVKAATLPTARAYTGKLDVPGMGQLDMTVVLARTQGGGWVGSVDVPAQMMLGHPLVNIEQDADEMITATLPVPIMPATILAKAEKETDALVGRFKQGPYDLEVNFARNASYVSPTMNRPQHPKPPFPYELRELSIKVPGDFEISGTLTLPHVTGGTTTTSPLAILISGSGQQDRDETLLGHKPFLVIADFLTRHGIAVFRYDDQGVGQSGGRDSVDQSTSQTFAGQVSAIVDHLKTLPEIDSKRIGLIGHSEGGLIAPMVAAERDDLAFIVLLAGPGVTGREILELQGKLILKAEGSSDEAIEQFSQQQRTALDMVTRGASEEEIRVAVTEAMEATEPDEAGSDRAAAEKLAELRKTQIDGQIKALTSPWMKYFVSFDPAPTLAKVRCPILALSGTLDLQVWHDQNLPAIEKAVAEGGGHVTIRRYDNLNHLFQPATKGGVSEYAQIETTFSEQVLSDIVEWINAVTKPEHPKGDT
jgi:pimeloyl-ACP methyl ester carboxylesterase